MRAAQMPVSARCALAWVSPVSRTENVTCMSLGSLTFSKSQLIPFECGFLGMMKVKVTVLKALKSPSVLAL